VGQIDRIIFIINCLIENTYSKKELQDVVWEKFSISPHNIYKDLRLINKIGFIIPGLSKHSSILRIESLPFKFPIYEEDKELIHELFNSYSNNSIQLNNFFERLSSFLNFELENIISEDNLIVYENKKDYQKIKKVLEKAKLLKKKIKFEYKAVDKEIKEYYGFPHHLEKDEKKVERVIIYHDFIEKYGEYNLDRIKLTPEILDKEVLQRDFPALFCHFKLYPPVSHSYHILRPLEDEISYDEEKGSKIIKARYYTPFRLIQKLLKYGEYAEILDPPNARDEMKRRILKMQNLYEKN
jgi:hypothetical protein